MRSAWGFSSGSVADWRDDAACFGTNHPDAWFVDGTQPTAANSMALRICHRCPVMDQCRDYHDKLSPIMRQGVIAGGVRFNSRGNPVRGDADV